MCKLLAWITRLLVQTDQPSASLHQRVDIACVSVMPSPPDTHLEPAHKLITKVVCTVIRKVQNIATKKGKEHHLFGLDLLQLYPI
jgi:hypothetical protein